MDSLITLKYAVPLIWTVPFIHGILSFREIMFQTAKTERERNLLVLGGFITVITTLSGVFLFKTLVHVNEMPY